MRNHAARAAHQTAIPVEDEAGFALKHGPAIDPLFHAQHAQSAPSSLTVAEDDKIADVAGRRKKADADGACSRKRYAFEERERRRHFLDVRFKWITKRRLSS